MSSTSSQIQSHPGQLSILICWLCCHCNLKMQKKRFKLCWMLTLKKGPHPLSNWGVQPTNPKGHKRRSSWPRIWHQHQQASRKSIVEASTRRAASLYPGVKINRRVPLPNTVIVPKFGVVTVTSQVTAAIEHNSEHTAGGATMHMVWERFPMLVRSKTNVWVTSEDPERNDILRLEDDEQGGVWWSQSVTISCG